jgi:ubiquinone/menaquinone biosynthesis C-methylase UbiE
MTVSISQAYNTRASTYDTATPFHSRLAHSYIKYTSPKPGESLLDLACGTGLVTFALAPHLDPSPSIIGADTSPGMLEVARSKLGKENGYNVHFIEHDIGQLDEMPELKGKEGSFDIITCCSALVLLPSPRAALENWIKFLAPGGRLVVDVPGTYSMLALKVFDAISPEFGVEMLGNRRWIKGAESLRSLLEGVGLDASVTEEGGWTGKGGGQFVCRSGCCNILIVRLAETS